MAASTSPEAGGPNRAIADRLRQVAFAHDQLGAPTPCLVVDEAALKRNIEAMAAVNPTDRLRPHVKAFKSTALAAVLRDAGHSRFTCATLAEARGLATAGLGDDVLVANETVDTDRLAATVAAFGAGQRLTVAVDSVETVAAASAAGVTDVVIDVNVGLPRCGCAPDDAAALAATARTSGLNVRGVMGYEGHLMMVTDRDDKTQRVASAMAMLERAAEEVAAAEGIISAGGTGTYDLHSVATEIQAGSYTLMDTDYAKLDLPFDQALWVEATVISVNHAGGWIVADAGLKAFGMDHGNPVWPMGDVWFCSDEHITLHPDQSLKAEWKVGDRVRLAPSHLDPTVARHERMWAVGGDRVAEWAIDLRYW